MPHQGYVLLRVGEFNPTAVVVLTPGELRGPSAPVEELLSPTPRRLDLAPLPGLALLVTLALRLGVTEGVWVRDIAILVAFAAAAALAVAAKAEDFDAAALATTFFLAAVAFPLSGLLLHAPILLLVRSVRARGWARHRGREAFVSGLVGLGALVWLLARAPEMFRAQGHCACEGPVASSATQLVAYVATAGVTAALTAFLVAHVAPDGVARQAELARRDTPSVNTLCRITATRSIGTIPGGCVRAVLAVQLRDHQGWVTFSWPRWVKFRVATDTCVTPLDFDPPKLSAVLAADTHTRALIEASRTLVAQVPTAR